MAVLNGIVLISYIIKLREDGERGAEAIVKGCLLRLRPVLMTALVALLGLVPLSLAHGMGSEVQRPLAVVVIGGPITSTLLTLVVLPALFPWFEERREERHPAAPGEKEGPKPELARPDNKPSIQTPPFGCLLFRSLHGRWENRCWGFDQRSGRAYHRLDARTGEESRVERLGNRRR